MKLIRGLATELIIKRNLSTAIKKKINANQARGTVSLQDRVFPADDWTNISPKISELSERRLLQKPGNPLWLLKGRLVQHFHSRYKSPMGSSPLFSLHDTFHPVVDLWENFDSLLLPSDHPSRSQTDTYYVNKYQVLRSHTSAHQHSLISAGRDAFLVAGDVYRRDEIDRSHFPVFHQIEGVRLFSAHELSPESPPQLFEENDSNSNLRNDQKQEWHTEECARFLEKDLKESLEALVKDLFGDYDIDCQWTSTYFPFTHPSWELEVKYNDEWVETLGCGIVEQKLLQSAGAGHKVGWAFGIGLERLAMCLYKIDDIRLFWSTDSGFLSQFDTTDLNRKIIYKPISKFPQCVQDMSFWTTSSPENPEIFVQSDFYDLVRSEGGEIVEQVKLIDEFRHPKTDKRSLCYRIIYRHPDKVLSTTEAEEIHKRIRQKTVDQFQVVMRV